MKKTGNILARRTKKDRQKMDNFLKKFRNGTKTTRVREGSHWWQHRDGKAWHDQCTSVLWTTLHDACLVVENPITIQYSVKPLMTVCELVFVCHCCTNAHTMAIFKYVCECFRVLIFRNRMSPWHPGVIHIKSQLALKFGPDPKVCSRETQYSFQLMAVRPTGILLQIDSDHSQWAKDRVSQWLTIALMAFSLLTAVPLCMCSAAAGVKKSWKLTDNICAICPGSFNWQTCNLVCSLFHSLPVSVCLNCNISKNYQFLFVLNFSPLCLCGEVFQNRKPWRQGGHHPPAASDFTRTPTIITVHTICSNTKLYHNTSQTTIYGASALRTVQLQVHRYSAFNKSFFLF